MKKVLVTAGSTACMIDKVRAITNIFKGRTGNNIAEYFSKKGCEVVLLTSSAFMINTLLLRLKLRLLQAFALVINLLARTKKSFSLKVISFKTFDDLARLMEEQVTTGRFDIIIHSAAVSDYKVAQTCVLDEDKNLIPLDSSTKISSSYAELYLKLKPTFKIVDLIRDPWNFQGKLIKFKLQVGISDEELLDIARKSRATSDADIIVANCLEWSTKYAYIVTADDQARQVSRKDLPGELFRRLI